MNTPAPLLYNPQVSDLRRLRSSSKNGPQLLAHFAHQQRQADSQIPEIQLAWFKAMKNVLDDINDVFKILPSSRQFHFLDVGCCPGGFSSYILSQCHLAQGTGISLPVKDGGHSLLLEEEYMSRFDLIWGDVTRFHLGGSLGRHPTFAAFPFPFNHPGFDLVILDSHPLRTTGADVHIVGDRLIISSLIFGMWCITEGGMMMVKLSASDKKVTAQILYMLDILSGDIRTWKPINIHATRSTFYVIAFNFGRGAGAWRFREILSGLKNLWDALMLGGSSYPKKTKKQMRRDMERRLESDDLDFIVDDLGLLEYSDRLTQLCKHVWEVEAESIKQWHIARKNGL